MTVKSSTGLRNAMLATSSFRALFHGTSQLRIYAGPIPANADAATTGATLLVTIRKDDTDPLGFETTPADGVLQKAAAETWEGTVAASGTAAFFRLVLTADDNAASTTAPRLQGTVGLAGADLVMTSTALVATALQSFNNAAFTLPPG